MQLVFTLDQSKPHENSKATLHACGVKGQPEMESPPAGSDHATPNVYMTKSSKKKSQTHVDWSALIDHGANGCFARRDMHVIVRSEKTIDLS